ncbi:hypothetical protein HaLaN_15017, partial [Haematococcus lacustris]
AAEQRPARPEPVAPEAAAEAPAEEPVELKQRGRTRPPKTRQDILPTPLPSAVEMDVEDVPAGMKKKKGINVGRVQKKKKRAGKAFMAVSQAGKEGWQEAHTLSQQQQQQGGVCTLETHVDGG